MNDILTALTEVLEERKLAGADESYVSSLHNKGLSKILEKVGEECIETILAAKDAGNGADEALREEVIKETADLWFHTLVMLSHLNMSATDVLTELERRFGLSGLEEKAARK